MIQYFVIKRVYRKETPSWSMDSKSQEKWEVFVSHAVCPPRMLKKIVIML